MLEKNENLGRKSLYEKSYDIKNKINETLISITKNKVLLFVFQLIQAKDSTVVGHARDFVRLIDCIIIKLYIILFNSKNIEFLKVFLVYCI